VSHAIASDSIVIMFVPLLSKPHSVKSAWDRVYIGT
jgi:hypothetical protein